MSYFLYILQMSNGQLYIGTTSNLPERLKDHARHYATQTTTRFGFEKLLYSEEHPTG